MTVLINILGQRIVVLPQIIFSNKQNIPWKEVERYLLRYIGTSAILTESQNIIHIEKPSRMNMLVQITRGLCGDPVLKPKQTRFNAFMS